MKFRSDRKRRKKSSWDLFVLKDVNAEKRVSSTEYYNQLRNGSKEIHRRGWATKYVNGIPQ